MSVSTTPAEILRSVYEGVSFSLVECAEALKITGDLVVSEAASVPTTCEILADTTGQRVVRQAAPRPVPVAPQPWRWSPAAKPQTW